MIIYKVTNTITGKKYIGQTIQPLGKRWADHCRSSYCRILSNAIKGYGKEAFIIEEIARCNTIEELNILEEQLIQAENTLHPNGYNMLPGGNNKKPLPESIKRGADKRRGRKYPYAKRGPYPKERGEAISASKKGKSNGLLGKKRAYGAHPKSRRQVWGINLATKDIVWYSGITEAAKALAIQHINIIKTTQGKRQHAGGYFWSYTPIAGMDDIPPKRKNPRAKAILQYTLEGVLVREWESANEARVFYKTGNITAALLGTRCQAAGFRWVYKLSDNPTQDIGTTKNRRTKIKTITL